MKTNFRLILLLAVIILGVTMMVAQTVYKDVVYLKNGSVIKGVIIETVPEKSIKIETADGNIFVYNMSEVEKIAKEKDTAAPSKESKPAVEPQRISEPQRSIESPRSEGSGSKFSIFGGAALPLGDFGKKDGDNAGMAKTGWTAGAQLVTGGSVGFLIEGSYSLNKYDLPMTSTVYPPAGKYEWTGYTSILALAGVKLGTDNVTGTNFFVAPLVGALFGKSPEIFFTPAAAGSATITNQPAGTCTGLAYGVAVQVIIADHITISGKYVASKPKFKFTVESPYPGVPSKEVESDPVNIAIAFITVGFAF